MSKQVWKAGNMLYPLPVVMVSVADKAGNSNIITIAWAGTICTNPAMVSISVRPERYSHSILKETGEFVINLTTRELAYATDYCGVKSGRDVDKFKECGLKYSLQNGACVFEGAEITVVLKKLYAQDLKEECFVNDLCKSFYQNGGYHRMYVCEIKDIIN